VNFGTIEQVLSGEERCCLVCGDCRDLLRLVPDCSIDSIVDDPPAGISFMGAEFDSDKGGRDNWIAWMTDICWESLRVLKPGGYLVCWALPRTSHWTATAVENAGFEIRDIITHVFGCLSEDTEILVDGRWEQYQKCEAGRLAMCYDSVNDSFSWQPISEVISFPYSDSAVRIYSDNTDQIVTPEHRCPIERSGAYVFIEASELSRQQEVRVPVLEGVRALLGYLPVPGQISGATEQVLRSGVPNESPFIDNEGEAQNRDSNLRDMQSGVQAKKQPIGREGEVLQQSLLRNLESEITGDQKAPKVNQQARKSWVDGRKPRELSGEHVRSEESCLERRRDVLQQARKLSSDQICEVPGAVRGNGSQGWLCDGASFDSGEPDPSSTPENRSGSPLESRSDEEQNNESSFVREQQGSQAVRASRFTKSDLVRSEIIDYSGVMWCVRVPTGAFVARRNGKVFITGNSGFPKSLNLSLAIDKKDGLLDQRQVVHQYTASGNAGTSCADKGGTYSVGVENSPAVQLAITRGATEKSRRFDGVGTAMKPAAEKYIIARKPQENCFEVLGSLLWLSTLFASIAEKLSRSNPGAQQPQDSAQCSAERLCVIPEDSPDQTDTSRSGSDLLSNLNTALLWKSTLDESLKLGSTFIIEMESGQITALKTLRSCLLKIIQENTTRDQTSLRELPLSVLGAARNFEGLLLSLMRTLTLFATANASTEVDLLAYKTARLQKHELETTSAGSEEWVVARKPLIGTLVDNALEHGTGGLNIDACRVATNLDEPDRPDSWKRSGNTADADAEKIAAPPGNGIQCHPMGRWPSNFLLSHDARCRCVGTKSSTTPVINRFTDGAKPFGNGAGHPYESSGGAASSQLIYECFTGKRIVVPSFASSIRDVSWLDEPQILLDQLSFLFQRLSERSTSDTSLGHTTVSADDMTSKLLSCSGSLVLRAILNDFPDLESLDSSVSCPSCCRSNGELLRTASASCQVSFQRLVDVLECEFHRLQFAHNRKSRSLSRQYNSDEPPLSCNHESRLFFEVHSHQFSPESSPCMSGTVESEQNPSESTASIRENRSDVPDLDTSRTPCHNAHIDLSIRLIWYLTCSISLKLLPAEIIAKSNHIVNVPPCPVKLLDEQSGESTSGVGVGVGGIWGESAGKPAGNQHGDSGGASRFFNTFEWYPELDDPFIYLAKPSTAEKEAGCDALLPKSVLDLVKREIDSDGLNSPRAGAGRGGGAGEDKEELEIWVNQDRVAVLQVAMGQSLPRVIGVSGSQVSSVSDWNTMLFGNDTTDQSQLGCRFTTKTKKSSTTTSRILNYLHHCATSENTAAATSTSMESNGSHAGNVELRGRSLTITFNTETVRIPGVENVSANMSLRITSDESKEKKARRCSHPTVKSIALMTHLIKLVTPPGGVTLSRFLGSGTDACAALLSGYRCIGFEQDAGYFEIAKARVSYWAARGKPDLPKPQPIKQDDRQGKLF
jgi:DNA modification methylase